jgi:hypothetical protein
VFTVYKWLSGIYMKSSGIGDPYDAPAGLSQVTQLEKRRAVEQWWCVALKITPRCHHLIWPFDRVRPGAFRLVMCRDVALARAEPAVSEMKCFADPPLAARVPESGSAQEVGAQTTLDNMQRGSDRVELPSGHGGDVG